MNQKLKRSVAVGLLLALPACSEPSLSLLRTDVGRQVIGTIAFDRSDFESEDTWADLVVPSTASDTRWQRRFGTLVDPEGHQVRIEALVAGERPIWFQQYVDGELAFTLRIAWERTGDQWRVARGTMALYKGSEDLTSLASFASIPASATAASGWAFFAGEHNQQGSDQLALAAVALEDDPFPPCFWQAAAVVVAAMTLIACGAGAGPCIVAWTAFLSALGALNSCLESYSIQCPDDPKSAADCAMDVKNGEGTT